MSRRNNTLHRLGRVYGVPGRTAKAPRPGYYIYQTVRKRVWKPLRANDTGTQDGNAYDPRNRVVQIEGEWVWEERIERVYVPPEAGQEALPARSWEDPPRGWNAFARSIEAIDTLGWGEFSVPNGVTGVACGLSAYLQDPQQGLGHIVHGLRLTGNRAYSLLDGADLGGYTAADVWRVRATHDEVQISRNGAVVKTERRALPLVRFYLAASLYWIGDIVFNPRVMTERGGHGELTLPALLLQGGSTPFGWGNVQLPALQLQARLQTGANMTLPALQMRGAQRGSASEAHMRLRPLRLQATAGWHAVQQTTAMMRLGALVMAGVAVRAPIAEGDFALPALQMQGLDGKRASGSLRIGPLRLRAQARAHTQAEWEEALWAPAGVSGQAVALLVLAGGLRIGVTWAAQTLLDAALQESVRATDGWATQALAQAIMEILVSAGGAAPVPSVSYSHVWNQTTGAASRYSVGFNSYARIGGRYFGANGRGVCLLAGDSDAGQPIDAAVGLGAPDLGTPQLKAISECYAGMSGSGHLYLKVSAGGREYVYRTRAFSSQMMQQRIDLGRGLRANVIGLEIVNQDGADFELDSVQFRVIELSGRRVQT